MKRHILTVLALSLLFPSFCVEKAGASGILRAFKKLESPKAILEKEGIEVCGTLELYSSYIWRGITLDSDEVLQHGFELSRNGFFLNYWANWDFLKNDVIDSNELDFSLGYEKNLAGVTCSAGVKYYGYYGHERVSREMFAGVEFDRIAFSPNITYYRDYSEWRTSYASLELEKHIPLNAKKKTSLVVSAHFGEGDNIVPDEWTWDAVLAAYMNFPLSETILFSVETGYGIPSKESDTQGFGYRKAGFFEGLRIGTAF